MAQIDLGKLKFQWKGNYLDSTAYEVDDVVFDKEALGLLQLELQQQTQLIQRQIHLLIGWFLVIIIEMLMMQLLHIT